MMDAVAALAPEQAAAPTAGVPLDLREHLARLEAKGDLVTIDREVSPEYEIAAFTRRSIYEKGPAFVFRNVAGHPGATVVGGAYATLDRVRSAIDATSDGAVHKYLEAMRAPIAPVLVEDGPVSEVFVEGNDVDFESLPIVKHCEKDSGYYITAGVQVTKDPGSDIQHLGIHRMMRFNGQEVGFWGGKERRIRRAIDKYEDIGQDTPMAIVIGGPPAFVTASCARVPHSVDKHGVAGALQGSPLELVQCRTVDLAVPARAEMVIEGYIPAGERRHEGPFGEFSGAYGHETDSPYFRVTGLMMRRDAMYQDFLTGYPICEDQALMYLPRSAAVYQSATVAHPEVKAVHWQVDSGNIYGVVVSIHKRLQTEAWNVIASVLGGPALIKQCIVVDDDIDVFDAEAVQWALSTRIQPHRDVHIFPTMVGAPLDPSAIQIRQTSKIGFDATIPLDEDRMLYERVWVPGEDTVTWPGRDAEG